MIPRLTTRTGNLEVDVADAGLTILSVKPANKIHKVSRWSTNVWAWQDCLQSSESGKICPKIELTMYSVASAASPETMGRVRDCCGHDGPYLVASIVPL